MQAELERIVQHSLQKAVEYEAKNDFGKAFAYYTTVLELCPSKRNELEKSFVAILCEWGLHLEQNDRLKDVIRCYENALHIYPKSAIMLNNYAAYLLKIDDPLKAIKYLTKALEIDKNYLAADRNLQNAYSMAVDRWHFSMLNDKARNSAFKEAIRKRVALGYNTVLDIGTGTGLLSLYAHDAGASEIYACEYSKVMFDIAKKVFAKNKANSVKLILKASTDLQIPKDLPNRAKLLITEIFDAALFGELVIPTLIDAHSRLLEPEGVGTVIPISASLYIAAVECEYIRSRSSVDFEKFHNDFFNLKNVVFLADEDFYDTESLENVNIHYITEPSCILNVNFNSLEDLTQYAQDGIKKIINTKCRYAGTIDGLVAWFKLHLDDEITIDSSQSKSCWQSAVFSSFPHKVEKNATVTMTAEILEGRLKCSYKLPDTSISIHEKHVYQMPREVITFLNDEEYISLLIKVAKDGKYDDNVKTIFDTCLFPVYGLTLLKENQSTETLYFQSDNAAMKHFIDHVFIANHIRGQVCYITDFNDIACSLDKIFMQNFDTKGELQNWGQQTCREIYRCLLTPQCDLLPERIYLMGQFIFSEELPKMVLVNDDNLSRRTKATFLGDVSPYSSSDDTDEEINNGSTRKKLETDSSKYKIAEFINGFSINQVFDLNSSLYTFEAVSDAKVLIEMDDSDFREETVNFHLPSNLKRPPNALLCWYKIAITDEYMIETKRNNCFMNHTAIVFKDEFNSESHEKLTVKVLQMKDIVKINLTL